jgi:basic membrane protein A
LAVLALVAAACGDSDDESTSGDQETTTTAEGGDTTEATEPTDTTEEATTTEGSTETSAGSTDGSDLTVSLIHNGRGDGSFNDSAVVGLDRAIADFGITPQEVVVNLTGGETGATEVQTVAASGADLNIGIGFLLTDAITAGAEQFTDVQFAIVDSVIEAPNVKGLVFAEEQGSFLVGAAAALTSQTGTIGFIGGVETDLIKKFEAGYIAGAEAANPDITVVSNYITQPPDFTGFGDPVKGKEIALSQLGQGADVIYAAAGGSGNGMFEAVKEANEGGTVTWAIGVDSDQASPDQAGVPAEVKPYILTSMIKRVDLAVYSAIESLVQDAWEPGGVQVFDLSVDGVGYATTGDHMSEDTIAQLEDFKAQIVAGDITVPTVP